MKRAMNRMLATMLLTLAGTATVLASDDGPDRSPAEDIVIDIDGDALRQIDLGSLLRELAGERVDRDELLNEILPRLLRGRAADWGKSRGGDVLLQLLDDDEGRSVVGLGEDILLTLLDEDEDSDEGEDPEEDEGGDEAQDSGRRRNYIGVSTRRITESLAAQLSEHLEEGQGLVVQRVQADSPAEEAGVKRHDVLISFEGTALDSPAQLRELILEADTGSEVQLTLVRAARQKTLQVTVGDRRSSFRDGRRSAILNLRDRVRPREHALEFLRRHHQVEVDDIKRRHREHVRGHVDQLRDLAKRRLRNHALSITSDDGKKYRVHIKLSGGGEEQEYTWEGTLDEIREQAEEQAEEIGEELLESLERLHEEEEEGEEEEEEARSFRFELQPRIAEQGRGFRIRIMRPGEEGGTKWFELDQTIDIPDEAEIEEYLLELEELRRELEELAPTIRERIEETIRSIRIPNIEVDVEETS